MLLVPSALKGKTRRTPQTGPSSGTGVGRRAGDPCQALGGEWVTPHLPGIGRRAESTPLPGIGDVGSLPNPGAESLARGVCHGPILQGDTARSALAASLGTWMSRSASSWGQTGFGGRQRFWVNLVSDSRFQEHLWHRTCHSPPFGPSEVPGYLDPYRSLWYNWNP